MIVTPVAIPDASLPQPDPNDLSTWAARMAEMHRWMRENLRPGANALGTAGYENALDAQASALAAAAASGAAMWSAATNYPTGTAVKSPLTYLTYVRKSPGGTNATDPSAAPTLWEPLNLTRVVSGMLEFWDTTTSQWVPAGWKTLAENVALTGSAYDLTGIPTWVKALEIEYSGVSSAGNDVFGCQLGSSAGVVTAGYETSAWGSGGSNLIGTFRHTNGFYISNGQASSFVMQGSIALRRHSGNLWRAKGSGKVDGVATNFGNDGSVSLPGALDRIRFNHNLGGAFDSGAVSIFARA